MKNTTKIEGKNSMDSRSQQPRKPIRIHTGPLVWEEAEFEAAVSAGRFVTVSLTPAQRIQLKVGKRRLSLRAFLPIANASQLSILRDATPLYWSEFRRINREPELTALRGNGPG